MRISSSLLYQTSTSAMSTLAERASELQTQISSEKKLVKPSDDPNGYRQLATLRRASADSDQDAKNVTRASSLLTQSDATLGQMEDQVQHARELAIQAASDTFPAEQKKVIAAELDAMLDDLVKLANTTDAGGTPIFAGADGNTPYTKATDGTVTYNGTGTPGAIPVGDGASVQATVTGDKAFGDLFATIKGLSDSLKSGGNGGTAIDDLKASLDQIGVTRSSVGARGARLDLETARIKATAVEREETRSAIEDTDIPAAVTELQKTMTVLQATQASFSKLSSLTLFDYLR